MFADTLGCMSSVGASKIVPAIDPAKPFELYKMSKNMNVYRRNLQDQSTQREIVLSPQHSRLDGDVERDDAAVNVGVHVVGGQLDETGDSAFRERAEGLDDTDETSNKLSVTDAGFRSANNERLIRTMRALEYLVDSLDFDEITQGCT